VAKLADAPDLGSGGAILRGSSPLPGKFFKRKLQARAKSDEMNSTFGLLSKWPLIRQIREGADGTGLDAMSEKTRAMHAGIDDAQVARSICPYCGVGCGQLI
jgi:hypothetical protein